METWKTLIMEMLTSAVQPFGPRLLTVVGEASSLSVSRLVSVRLTANGPEMHQPANVSSFVLATSLVRSLYDPQTFMTTRSSKRILFIHLQLLTVATWMILKTERLTSPLQYSSPGLLTAATQGSSWWELRLVSVKPMGNGPEKHQLANVSLFVLVTSLPLQCCWHIHISA